MRPKRYLSLWYVLRKPCTYLLSTLTPSPNVPNEIPHDPRHLGVPSGASKTLSEPMVRLAQTVHQSYINTNISKWTERDSRRPTSPRSFMVWPKYFLSLWYVLRKPCTYLMSTLTPSPNGLNEIPHDPRHLGVPSRASKTISEPTVCSAQTVHRSCVKISLSPNGPK